jgi:hypothetical protein
VISNSKRACVMYHPAHSPSLPDLKADIEQQNGRDDGRRILLIETSSQRR